MRANLRRLLQWSLATASLAVMTAITGCPARTATLSAAIGARADLKTFANALEITELDNVLALDGPFTVLAPNDTAFGNLPAGTLNDLLLPQNRNALAQLVKAHVVFGTFLVADLKDGQILTNLDGNTLTVTVSGSIVKVDGATIVVPDIRASNGVIDVIDSVLAVPQMMTP